ncbi:hypothetical protein COOONC_20811 [Cooperia oncophora]
MVQHKIKQKTTLPKGVKQKTKKTKPAGPKRGHNLYIPPKKQHLIQQAASIEGEKPTELLAHFSRLSPKQRQIMFDQVTAASRINCKSFLENRAKHRLAVPIHDKKRVVLTVVRFGRFLKPKAA